MTGALEAIDAVDQLIKTGQHAPAREKLQKLFRGRPQREYLPRLANLAWRLDQADWGLRALHPVVRGEAFGEATAAERAEYAACLIRIGLHREAQPLLETVAADDYAPSLLYQSFALFHAWNYKESIPVLRAYAAHESLSEYQRQVALANLISALIYERKATAASQVISQLVRQTSEAKRSFLHGTALRLAAVSLIYQGKCAEARKYLEAAREALSNTEGQEAFLVRKWFALADYVDKPTAEGLATIRSEANERRHSETLRDCDRFECLATKNVALRDHLYFGTPYASFRHRLLKDFGTKPPPPAAYLWGSAETVIDLSQGEAVGAREPLPVGHLLHRLLLALTRDFYQPLSPAGLFYEIFPGEFFNPSVSLKRVHEATRRLREWMKKERIGAKLEAEGGTYRLLPGESTGFRLSSEPIVAKFDQQLRRLGGALGTQPFSVAEVGKELGLSPRASQRFLQEALESGAVVREGKARATRYRFAS